MIKTLKAKLMFSFAIIILVNALVGVFTITQLSAIRDDARAVIEVDLPLLNGFGQSTEAVNAELLAMREYRYSGNARYRDEFAEAHQAWLASLETLRPLLAKPELQTYAENLEQAAQTESEFYDLFQLLVEQNDSPETTATLVTLDAEIDASYDSLIGLLDALDDSIKGYIAADTEGIYESARFLSSLLLVGALLAAVIGVVAALWMIRSTMQQLGLDPAVLNEMAKRQAEGYLDADNQQHRGVPGCG